MCKGRDMVLGESQPDWLIAIILAYSLNDECIHGNLAILSVWETIISVAVKNSALRVRTATDRLMREISSNPQHEGDTGPRHQLLISDHIARRSSGGPNRQRFLVGTPGDGRGNRFMTFKQK